MTGGASILGYSQPGASANTLEFGSNAVILIQLDGSALSPTGVGLALRSGNYIEGLAIGNFQDVGILISVEGYSSVVGNFLGTNAAGTVAHPNTIALYIAPESTHNTIGGAEPAKRNVFAGNIGQSMESDGSHNTIQNNYIGTDPSGTVALPNGNGITLNGTRDLVTGNVIAGNTYAGIGIPEGKRNKIIDNSIGLDAYRDLLGNGLEGINVLFDATHNRIARNRIASSGALGIDLNHDGVTPNDRHDLDSGPNGLQNYPVLQLATTIRSTFAAKSIRHPTVTS